MLFTTAILAAILVSLALMTLAAAVVLLRARRALAALATPALVSVESTHARDQRLVASLVQIRSAATGAHSGAERALSAVTRFDSRAERLETAMVGQRQQMDQATQLMVGMGGQLDRLRSIARLVIG